MKEFKRILALALAFVMTVSVLTVAPSTTVSAAPSKYVKSLSLSKKKLTIESGKKASINATVKVKGSASKKVKVTLSKANKKVVKKAKVGKANSKGVSKITFTAAKVTAKKSTTIKVVTSSKNSKNKAITKTIKVTVAPKKANPTPNPTPNPAPSEVVVTNVVLDKSVYTIEKGKSVQVIATVEPENATNKAITYSVADTNIATVTDAGILFGFSAGTTTITATASNGKSATATVKVEEPAVLTLNKTELEIGINQTANLIASATDVTWKSDNEDVAVVDQNGKVTGRAAGVAYIIATSGSLSASCKVTVSKYNPENDGVTLSVFNPIKNNDGTVIDNTCLVNQDMIIQAYVQKDTAPVEGARVKLNLEAIDVYGVSSRNFVIKVNGTSSDTATTNKEGIAEFTVTYDANIESTYEDLYDAPYASFDVSTLVDNQPNDKNIIVKFASVLRGGIQVDNNKDITLPDIVPFEGHADGDNGIKNTTNTNGYYDIEYVSSQQTGANDEVYMSATPKFILPPTRITTEDKFEVVFPSKEVTTGQQDVVVNGSTQTDSYSIYNEAADMTTTTEIVNIPAGLVSMSVYFNRISVSKYSELYIDLYNWDGTKKGTKVWSKKFTDDEKIYSKEEGVQVENINGMVGKGILIVSLRSPGQVDVSKTGYSLNKIVGDYNTNAKGLPEEIEIVDSVVWNDVTASARYSVAEEMTYEEISEYLVEYVGSENNYLMDNSNYSFEKRMPVFNSNAEVANAITGNALLTSTYTSPDGTKTTATFAYPVVHKQDNSGKYVNANELVEKTSAIKAIFLGSDVIDANGDVQQQTGGIKQIGNQAVISSASNKKSGVIFVEARLKIDALGKEIKAAEKINDYDKHPINGANSKYPLYSYVQFVAPPETLEADGVAKTFHAIEDQYVVVTGEVMSGTGEVQTDQPVEFYWNDTKITSGAKIGDNDSVQVRYIDEKTNKDGKAFLVLSGDRTAIADGIEARYEGEFKTFNTYVGNQKFEPIKEGKEFVNKCNIHWIDLGLSYQKDVTTAGSWIYSFTAPEKTESDAVVDQKWKVGFLPVTECPGCGFDCNFDALQTALDKGETPKNLFKDVTNVGVDYETEGVNNDVTAEVTESNGNAAVTITSPKTGSIEIIGKLELKQDSVHVEYYDSFGDLQSFDTVGVSKVNVNDQALTSTLAFDGQIDYTMTWKPGNWDSTFVHPYGMSVDKGQATTVYFKLHDKNNNPVDGQSVVVSAKFNDVTYDDYTVLNNVTDENGLVAISVNSPNAEGDLIFEISVEGVTFKKSSSPIRYVTNTVSTLVFDGEPTFDSTNNKKVTLKFNNQINKELWDANMQSQILSKLFTVKDKDGNLLEIANISVGVKEVTIELAKDTFIQGANYTVAVSTGDECTIGGITYVLSDVNGYAITSSNATKSFTVSY